MVIKKISADKKSRQLIWLFVVIIGTIALISYLISNNSLSTTDLKIIIDRLPYILIGNQEGWEIKGGFAMNIIISISCMILATIFGLLIGITQTLPNPILRLLSWSFTQFFRNSPWLVILFVIFYLLPFEINLGLFTIPFSPIVKSILGLALVVAANISEIVRGAIQSIPSGQWEASAAMGYTYKQTLLLVILPQSLQRMIPPWMNWYAILTMGTTLTNLVGVPEGLTAVREVLALEGEKLAIPLYAFLMLLFFAYCYPIALWTKRLERWFNY